MRAQNVLGPESGGGRIEALKDQRSSRVRRDLAPKPTPSQAPSTAMCDAFLSALARWAARHHSSIAKISIPTGRVNGDELARVVIALIGRRPP
ncbi:MAG: hypothetical protein WAU74_01395 [Pseudolabrys sp.]